MQILLKLAWILTFTIQAYFRRIYMESSEHNAYISCQEHEQADFWQLENIFSPGLFSLDISAYPIISQI